ncbi:MULTISPECIES: substrate-binding periplasmic protein [Roseateles]|uniref:Transporter substrate-binding domain-containing protein n=1 Tax=Roseateles albus TaxID=2987525 RepID=A0ABT5KB07_9BURK|nr:MULTISPECIES: transporter substrate-binding domain-containing protein [Roseateles]MCV2359017.1 transporter substrate-binding domain-containing protein [Paucibacter sp. TC2R-5]MDC8771112.1 transporter substrate-binding domain-containing protein [Roseateles albus]
MALLCLSLLAQPLPAAAQAQPQTPAAAAQLAAPAVGPPLRILLNDVAPYTLHGEVSRPGMHHEIMLALAREAALPVALGSAVYVRLAMGLKDGSADLVVGVEGPELEELAQRVTPFHVFKFVVLTKKASDIRSVAQLKGKLLGVARGAFYDDAINKDDAIRKFGVADPFQGVRMLALDRLDAVISSDYLLSYALKQSGVDLNQFNSPFTVNEKSYVLYARRELGAETVRRLQRAMESLQKSGQIERILRSYQ